MRNAINILSAMFILSLIGGCVWLGWWSYAESATGTFNMTVGR